VKARDDAERAAGREALRAAGIGDGETAPAALLPLAGREPALDRAIVERLAREPAPDRAAALRDLATAAGDRGWKAVAKDARRALYRFEQRGVPVPPPPAPPAVARRSSAGALEGYLSPIDGRGDRLVWLVRPRPEGGLVVLTGMLNEPEGLREVAVAEIGRKALRRMARDLAERHRLTMVPADALYCDALLVQGFERARAAGTAGVGELPAYRTRLVTGDPASLEPPLATRVLGPDGAPAEAAAGGAALLDEPELATWLLGRDLLAPYLAEIADARESPLLLSRAQQEDRVRGIVTRALHTLFAGAAGATFRRRLEETAYYLWATGRREPARTAAATAAALATSRRGGEGIPFCEELVRRSLAALASDDAARARGEAEGSVIVRPWAAPGPGAGRTPRG
jgi:hypothetical protein